MGYIAIVLLLGTLGVLVYLSEMRDEFVRKIIAILSFSISLFLFLSFLSYAIKSNSNRVNLGGPVGYHISKLFMSNLGYIVCFGLSILLSVFGIYSFRGRWERERAIKGGLLLLFLFFLTSQLSVILRGKWFGSVNISVSSFLSKYLSAYGASIVLLALIAITLLPALLPLKRVLLGLKSLIFRQKPKVVKPTKPQKKPTTVEPSSETSKTSPPPVGTSDSDILTDRLPSYEALIALLNEYTLEDEIDTEECQRKARGIEEKLREFEVEGKIVAFHPGPVVTRYEFEPAPGVKISKILSLADDLAMRMKTHKIRIEAPLPGSGLIGIEVPNEKRRIVTFKEMVNKEGFKALKSKLAFALGVDTAGHPVYGDLAKMPHLLIAGATGSGKSVSINAIIASILFRSTPKDVRLLLIDPKRVELSYYEGVPHLLRPVVLNPRESVLALREAVRWMEDRYRHFSRDGVRDIESHNATLRRRGEKEPIPYIVIIIDEFGDLITTMSKDIEEPLARLAQMARAVGIHLVVATQRPSVKVITGTIKTNFPVRIAFKVPSRTDSRVILDEIGAEKLLGKGDMLFIPPGTAELKRLHGPLITEDEIKRIAQNLTTSYLENRFSLLFPGIPGVSAAASEIVEKEEITALTRSDLPGIEERFERIVLFVSSKLNLPHDQVQKALSLLKSTYYPPVPDIEVTPRFATEGTESSKDVDIPEGWDPLLYEASKLIVSRRIASATLLQRKMKIGFARAARILDQLEELGVVGPPEGSKPREVLVGPETLEEKLKELKNRESALPQE